jgi:hypothetical protein
MTSEKWIIHPGETRVIDVDGITRLKAGLVGGQIDIVGHDEDHVRVEVHSVAVKELRIEVDGTELEIDHPQCRAVSRCRSASSRRARSSRGSRRTPPSTPCRATCWSTA